MIASYFCIFRVQDTFFLVIFVRKSTNSLLISPKQTKIYENKMKKNDWIIVLTMILLGEPMQAQKPAECIAKEQIDTQARPVKDVKWDAQSLIIDDGRVVPVMGEIHYSRLLPTTWADEVRKMKEGGVTIIATYVFWNHIEEQEGIFNWSGQRNLRAFLEVCQREGMPVVLRIGPFCHGEVRNGGIPDWMCAKGVKMRQENPIFMHDVEQLYRQIFTQVQGLQWKDGGPIIACQFDNEYRGRGSYLMALKKMAQQIGFCLPFYTRTGWPELATPVPYGEMLPLYGDYADGFWERSLAPTAGNYYKAFQFKAFRSSTAIATEQLGKQDAKSNQGNEQYPYFTCELGGGMASAYHRRPYMYPEDAYSMALVKLGSGSNLLGYYMYHGGTNPVGHTYLHENQRTPATNYNDMPVLTYDFQAPLGEFGQRNPHYYMLRKLHLFMHDWGATLAPMQATFPVQQDLPKGDNSCLRWAYRSTADSGFVFVNNYERLQHLSAKPQAQFDVLGERFPQRPITIPSGAMAIFPVHISGIRYATAQLIAQREGKIYLSQIKGIPTEIAIESRILKNVKPKGPLRPVYRNIYLLTDQQAQHLFLTEPTAVSSPVPVDFTKTKEANPLRTITIGARNVAEEPQDSDFQQAAVYELHIPSVAASEQASRLLHIAYRGDVARLYADGVLIEDNFYNGRPMEYPISRIPAHCKKLELYILPLQANMPIYLPQEADATPGEQLLNVSIQ